MANWYFGTSGLILPVANKSHYPADYQSGSRLHYYGSLYNTIEINSTFYRLPLPGTVVKWASEVPADFTFTFKIPKVVSHDPGKKTDLVTLARFLDIVNGVGRKKGFLLLQVPAKMNANTTRLKQVFTVIQKHNWPIAFESRNSTWYEEPVEKLIESFGVTRVIHDWWSFPIPLESSSRKVYLRFHGPEKNYRGSYSDDFLRKCATGIRIWLNEGKMVYAYFNNTLGNVRGNLQTLIDMVA